MKLDLKQSPEGVTLHLKVIPKAHKNSFDAPRDGRLLVRLKAPPVDGKANEALIAYLAKTFGVRKSDVTICAGVKSRKKTVFVSGLDAEQVFDLVRGLE